MHQQQSMMNSGMTTSTRSTEMLGFDMSNRSLECMNMNFQMNDDRTKRSSNTSSSTDSSTRSLNMKFSDRSIDLEKMKFSDRSVEELKLKAESEASDFDE